MDSLLLLAEEDAEFVELLLELAEKFSRLDAKRMLRMMEEEINNVLYEVRAA